MPARFIPSFVLANLVVSAICLAVPARAEAHAKLQSSQPAADAVVQAPLTEITLKFDEEAKPVAVTLTDGQGKAVAGTGPVRFEGTTLHYPLAFALPAGRYALSYRVVARDSHVTAGTMTFTVTEAVK